MFVRIQTLQSQLETALQHSAHQVSRTEHYYILVLHADAFCIICFPREGASQHLGVAGRGHDAE